MPFTYSELDGETIAIVGAGFSGTLTAINIVLAERSRSFRVLLIEKAGQACRGLAYRYDDDNLLLNVPAGNMSAFPGIPDHFVAFCQKIDPAFNAKSFISRRLYGDYLEQTLNDVMELHPDIISIVDAEIISVTRVRGRSSYRLGVKGSRDIIADKVVLALGHFAPALPSGISGAASDCVINTFDFAAIDALDRTAAVVVIGMGHTAIDAVFRLTSCNPTRPVYMISRRGLLPHGHRFDPKPPVTAGFPSWLGACPAKLLSYMQAIRAEIARRKAAGGDWRDVFNELRPHTATIWKRFPEAERRKFLRKVLPYWDIHRHRLAPASERRIARLIESGRVIQLSGTLVKVDKSSSGLQVDVSLKKSKKNVSISVGALLNATGPSYDIAAVEAPIFSQLLRDGLIRQDAQKIGVETGDNYQLVAADGSPLEGLYYIGPMLKATYWEAVAVPELRTHALRLAQWLSR